MSNKSRIYYKPRWCSLNGYFLTSLNDVSMSTDFNLEQCFCSCAPWPLKSMRDQYEGDDGRWIEVHYNDCPNAETGRFLRYITEAEREEYRKIYRQK